MGYTQVALEDRLMEMYPEIERNGVAVSLEFDSGKNTWIIRFTKGNHKRYAFLDKKDADACMDGQSCIYMGTLISQYVKDLEREIQGQ